MIQLIFSQGSGWMPVATLFDQQAPRSTYCALLCAYNYISDFMFTALGRNVCHGARRSDHNVGDIWRWLSSWRAILVFHNIFHNSKATYFLFWLHLLIHQVRFDSPSTTDCIMTLIFGLESHFREFEFCCLKSMTVLAARKVCAPVRHTF